MSTAIVSYSKPPVYYIDVIRRKFIEKYGEDDIDARIEAWRTSRSNPPPCTNTNIIHDHISGARNPLPVSTLIEHTDLRPADVFYKMSYGETCTRVSFRRVTKVNGKSIYTVWCDREGIMDTGCMGVPRKEKSGPGYNYRVVKRSA